MIKQWIQTIAIIGFVSKGFVYVVIGILSFLAAFNLGGQSSGTNSALLFLERQPFGQFMLAALAVGLLCYSLWMFIRSIRDPENMGWDGKWKLMRIGIFITAIVYTFLSLLAFYHLFKSGTAKNNHTYLNFIGSNLLSILFIIIGIALLIQSVFLCIGIYRGGLMDQFNLEGKKGSHLLRIGGQFGFYARAFVVLIIAYFFLRAGFYSGNHEVKGIQDAFSFLDSSTVGRILMGITAIGFVSYGLFYILLIRYRTFE
ncbi:DUF1206 domain-containing protein [Aequorivita sp. H23M31]|uniref:DUF1206 domain-containing protein n=1 Tax=Aequorivita ciconiae TaxID=2494375 RepID=A0A410G612_9FLAO|nr:DUF1206 domain-containing protein [Aequorivita sp. H23M31]QAA82717.1 DUF1206 domain-containing protein [Aequorivita sp. H23M31]